MLTKMLTFTALAATLCLNAPAQNELRVPGFTSYFDMQPQAENPVDGTGEPGSPLKISWFGDFPAAGKVDCAVALHLSANTVAKLRLTVAGKSFDASATNAGGGLTTVPFGPVEITGAGYQQFKLELLNDVGIQRDDVAALILDGPAAVGAHFNLKERRNAASVHLAYPTPGITNINAFYCEVTAVMDPIWTYFEACGFHRGYFGMQVNSPTERRVIFSVWDSGHEAVSRSKVAAKDRVTLLAKGENVVAGDFGNEGTGGHSHLVYPWKTGEKQRFLITSQPTNDNFTVYSGYYFHPGEKKWMLIASFKAPNDGEFLHGLYSFCENFGGDNGELQRKARYGNQWIHTADGQWREQTIATFSHDPTGKQDRLDRFMGVEDGQFFLSNGGFVPGSTKYGEKFTRPATANPPSDFPVAWLP